MIHQLDLIEDDTDTMQIGLRQQLQAVEQKYNPIDVMFLYKILEWAIIIAMIFEFAGAYLAGGEVTATIRNGIIDSNAFADTPDLLVLGMIASLLPRAPG
ncbi:UNVERIFIED_CONTAM: hypothetical protein K2H54_000347 [Gekko kuhli]